MKRIGIEGCLSRAILIVGLVALSLAGLSRAVLASTYVVFVPLDSPIYDELDTLDGMGLLDQYIPEVRPIARIEAARLKLLQAESNLDASPRPLGDAMVRQLKAELAEEIGWIEDNSVDYLPTMIHPADRFEAQYIYSSGERRRMVNNATALLQAVEGTPLVPNNDGIPTSPGNNEVARLSGWAGAGSFLTVYGEGALAGPISHGPTEVDPLSSLQIEKNRATLLRGEVVTSFGNAALSWGLEETAWGVGHFGQLSQSANARPFPALRVQNIYARNLPGFLKYLGPARVQGFLGQLDHNRTFAYPWLSGQVISFKPTPNFEMGIDHVIMFGGRGNDNYSWLGFMGRATGFSTGNALVANTNSRAGVFFKIHFPSLRHLVLYQETLGEDNLTTEARPIGRFLPFLAVSYQGGAYMPCLTSDCMTTARFEYAILEPGYSTHSDSLYWTSNNLLMGDPMGPNASQLDLAIGRWFGYRTKIDLDGFYTERAPKFGVPGLHKERSGGFAVDILRMPQSMNSLADSLAWMRARFAFEYVHSINYAPDANSVRVGLVLSGAINPSLHSYSWR